MSLPLEELNYLACPQCMTELRYTREKVFFCLKCRHCFPLEEGVPNLSMDKAVPISTEGELLEKEKKAGFFIQKGPHTGLSFSLDRSSCKAIGRALDDEVTQVYNIDFTMSFDEHSKKLIRNYLEQFNQRQNAEIEGGLGRFKRLPDLLLEDQSVSKLHAMIFYGDQGAGILDLVSRNGTFVNDSEVESKLLKPGDIVKLGSTELVFSYR